MWRATVIWLALSAGCGETEDADQDGVLAPQDCDDHDPSVRPDAEERCDGVDQDCDGKVDEDLLVGAFLDQDGDGRGDPDRRLEVCAIGPGTAAEGDDCDDGDPTVFPGAEEGCDGVDQDCDGSIDEDLRAVESFADLDGDGHGDEGAGATGCDVPFGRSETSDDCDDADPRAFPGAIETCDGTDEDCDGAADEGLTERSYVDGDGDGFGNPEAWEAACPGAPGFSLDDRDCDDADPDAHPGGTEVCDGTDDDCDGLVDDGVLEPYYVDADGDGYGDPALPLPACGATPGVTADATDCDDRDDLAFPGNPEVCDAIDNDCDGAVDGGLPTRWYADADGDGLGDPWSAADGCAGPADWISTAGDCDDGDASVPPGCPATMYGDFATRGADDRRSSHVIGTVGSGTLSFAWSSDFATGVPSVAIAEGRIYAGLDYYFGTQPVVAAFDLYDGTPVWQTPLPVSFAISGPTWADGLVCFTRCNHSTDSQVRCLDADDGTEAWSAPISMQWEGYVAPLALDGALYSGGGSYGGLYGHLLADGDQLFFDAGLPQRDGWGAAAFDGVVYSWVDDLLTAHAPGTGAHLWELDFLQYSFADTWPVLSEGGVALLARTSELVAVDVRTQTELWRSAVTVSGPPAVAGGSAYVVRSDGEGKRLDLLTGAVTATYAGDSSLVGTPVVTDDAVVVASAASTYVYDLASGALLQQIPAGGAQIAIGDNHLALLSSAGELEVWSW